MPKTKQTPGSALSALLKKYNLNYNRLAKTIGLSSAMVRLIARDENPVSAAVAFRLAKFFKMKPEFWLSLQMDYDKEKIAEDKALIKALKDIPTVDVATFERKPKAAKAAKTVKTAKSARGRPAKATAAKSKAAPKKAVSKKAAIKPKTAASKKAPKKAGETAGKRGRPAKSVKPAAKPEKKAAPAKAPVKKLVVKRVVKQAPVKEKPVAPIAETPPPAPPPPAPPPPAPDTTINEPQI